MCISYQISHIVLRLDYHLPSYVRGGPVEPPQPPVGARRICMPLRRKSCYIRVSCPSFCRRVYFVLYILVYFIDHIMQIMSTRARTHTRTGRGKGGGGGVQNFSPVCVWCLPSRTGTASRLTAIAILYEVYIYTVCIYLRI